MGIVRTTVCAVLLSLPLTAVAEHIPKDAPGIRIAGPRKSTQAAGRHKQNTQTKEEIRDLLIQQQTQDRRTERDRQEEQIFEESRRMQERFEAERVRKELEAIKATQDDIQWQLMMKD